MTTAEVQWFEAEFAPPFVLARQQRCHHLVVEKELDAAGVKPARKQEGLWATFYRKVGLTIRT